MFEPIDPIGVRVLGALIEKALTTPDNYPLTLNALTAACNQTSNRDPVMELDEGTVMRSLDRLALRTLVRGVHRGDARVMRYREELSQSLHLHQPELAALAVMLLRGPQTAGEIRTRTARMFEFVDPRHVEITLESLTTLPTPLVAQLPRRPGQKETRYAHLLSGEPQVDITPESAAGDGAAIRTRAGGAAHGTPTNDRIDALEQELGALRAEVADLRGQLETFRRQFE